VSGFREEIQAAIAAPHRHARARTRDREAADDLVQDKLVRALRAERLFQGGIRSWLFTIQTNLNRNRLRALSRRPQRATLEDMDGTLMRRVRSTGGASKDDAHALRDSQGPDCRFACDPACRLRRLGEPSRAADAGARPDAP
jgi:DNA-directed RNA polymerase specialized sigma24 family protein